MIEKSLNRYTTSGKRYIRVALFSSPSMIQAISFPQIFSLIKASRGNDKNLLDKFLNPAIWRMNHRSVVIKRF